MDLKKKERRSDKFKKNDGLETFLAEINSELWNTEKILLNTSEPKYPIIFVVGPLRSGSTLMIQWLASTGQFAYPTNLLSRFYCAPIIGAKIQQLLTDERYNFRNEILDFNQSVDFHSENGKTKGALSPNEFWYFWRRFLPFEEIDYLPDEELFEKVDIETMKAEFNGLLDVFQKPFALKAMILNYNIPFLNEIFDRCIFVYTKRDPLTNIESALKARERQLGSMHEWYSFKIPEYNLLKKIDDPIEQTAKQIFCINKAVEKGLAEVEGHKKIVVQYEDFCNNPELYYNELVDKLNKNGYDLEKKYHGEDKFTITRKGIINQEIENAYAKAKLDCSD